MSDSALDQNLSARNADLSEIEEMLYELVKLWRKWESDTGDECGHWHGLEGHEEEWLDQELSFYKKRFTLDDELCCALQIPTKSTFYYIAGRSRSDEYWPAPLQRFGICIEHLSRDDDFSKMKKDLRLVMTALYMKC